ncbi:MAG: hypothetical protein OXC38_04820 [Gammaproteobacteria bacterium]|nr:hypothetical protein [Gammaproteobacteria bacterium]
MKITRHKRTKGKRKNGNVMTQDEQREIFQRLKSAQKRSQEAFEKTERGWDLHSGTQIASWWAFVAAGYSGIEQSFKFMIAMERGVTIECLLSDEESNLRTHNLSRLFGQMDKRTKRVLSEYYKRFQSLHNYIRIKTLQKFLKEVSGTGGKGYEQWRYALIEPGPIPPNSVDCMLAIWDACVQWMTHQQHPKQRIWMPELKLLKEFEDILERIYREPRLWRKSSDGRPADSTGDLQKWYEEHGHPLNAFAQLIWNDYRGIPPEETADPDWLANLLRVWLERIKSLRESSNQTSLAYFIERAKGNTMSGLGIRWNADKTRFEDIPWNLEEIMQEEVPDSAIRMDGEKAEMRNGLLQRMYKDGFDVKENGFRSPQAKDETWVCSLMAEKEQASGEKVSIKVWEQKWSPDLYVEINGADSGESTDTQRWIQCWAAIPDQE